MPEPAQLPLGFSESATDGAEEVTETLPPFDNGYYDALAAIGFAALADAYFDTPATPLIQHTPTGFAITYRDQPRERPSRHWLKYSIAASWEGDLEEGKTKKAAGWDGETLISTEGAAVDVAKDATTKTVEVAGKTKEVRDPERVLYGVINSIGQQVEWFNLCIHACRHRGEDLLSGAFEESKVTFNSVILPQTSKGGGRPQAFDIENRNALTSVSKPVSRQTCLAVAGLIYCANGYLPANKQQKRSGIAVPVPRNIRLNSLHRLVQDNRKRSTWRGFFFPYDNYLNNLMLLLTYQLPQHSLVAIAGADFLKLGNSSSPSGTWQLAIPKREVKYQSAERLKALLSDWRWFTSKGQGEASVDRNAVRRLMMGFEEGNVSAAVDGYLSYIAEVGLKREGNEQPIKYKPLHQTFFEDIMAHDYSDLLDAFQQEDVQKFIKLVRQDTYQAVYWPEGKDPQYKPKGPNYQMMRRLREVQSTEDLVQALTEIAIERGTGKLASAKGNKDEMKFMSMPYEPSITHLVRLAEDDRYSPRLIAQLVLALALCRREHEQDPNETDGADVPEATETE